MQKKELELIRANWEQLEEAAFALFSRHDIEKRLGLMPRSLTKAYKRGENKKSGTDHDVFVLLNDAKEYWIEWTENQIFRRGLMSQEEVTIEGFCRDERTGVDLKVRTTYRPPDVKLGIRWLEAHCPERWKPQTKIEHAGKIDKQDTPPAITVQLTGPDTKDIIKEN